MAAVPRAMFVIETSGAKLCGSAGDPDDPAGPGDAGASGADDGETVAESGIVVYDVSESGVSESSDGIRGTSVPPVAESAAGAPESGTGSTAGSV